MKKLALTLVLAGSLGLGACAADTSKDFYPVDANRTAGHNKVDTTTTVYAEPVVRTRRTADRTFDRSMSK